MPTPRRSSRRSARSSAGGGLGHVKKAEQQQKKRAAARDRKWLKLDDGDVVIVRLFPTEEFFKDGFVHRTPMEHPKTGKKMYPDIMCLDQDEDGTPCPGCKDELQRRYKFWTPVIVRDYEDENGKTADMVAVWSGGITIAKRLEKMQSKHKLDKRDIEVERSGSTKDDTEYSIEWSDEEDVPYSSKDKKLMENAPDLTRYTRIPEFDDFYKPLGDQGEDESDIGEKAVKRNPFSKKKGNKASEDDEDDKPRRSSARSGSSRPTVRRRRSK